MADAPTTQPFVRDDVRTLLDMMKAMNRPPVEEVGAVAGREGMRAMAQIGEMEPKDLAVIRDVTCPGPDGDVPCRFYDSRESREAGPAVLFLHGGGFVIGDLDVYHSLCTEFAHRLPLPVLSVDYRLPKRPSPPRPTIAKRRRDGSHPRPRHWAVRLPDLSSAETARAAT